MPELIEAIADGVAVLTLNRPDSLNALSTPITQGLLDGLPRLAADPAVGVIVITGAGRGFCAGGDVKSMAEPGAPRSEEEAIAHLRSREEVSRLLHEIDKPTIAMVNGPAAGAGLSIALACDLRFAGESARFVTAFARIGFSGDFGGSYFLTRLVGTAKARELYFSPDPVLAPEALTLGLVNRVYPDARLEEETLAFAKAVARGPRLALGLMKQNLNFAENASLSDLLDLEARHMVRSGRTEDNREAIQAFVEKRTPVFLGR
jgi:2-(1,2-epoxy-1,2-dihydrophenyl)acetyl-CoA isomerase